MKIDIKNYGKEDGTFVRKEIYFDDSLVFKTGEIAIDFIDNISSHFYEVYISGFYGYDLNINEIFIVEEEDNENIDSE